MSKKFMIFDSKIKLSHSKKKTKTKTETQKNNWNKIKKISVVRNSTIMFAKWRNTCMKCTRITSCLYDQRVKGF